MPHDRFFGLAAEEIAKQDVDKDLFARAYALALGDAEKTKAIYIGIRAERLEEMAQKAYQYEVEAAKREEARLKKENAEREAKQREVDRIERERARSQEREAIERGLDGPSIDPAVRAMREALKATKWH